MIFTEWLIMVAICGLQMCLISVNSDPGPDRIASLPDQPQVGFKQYAGYISVDEKQERNLFYYFVEAENEPDKQPLVLWLNGGPGCSSVGFGAFNEHGPFVPRGKVLIRNNQSWNREANMLYLESPAGVGFSYSANESFYNYLNDNVTAQDNLAFLEHWFDKFPEYKNREFFITGESYAGHYAPQLANLILQSKANFNLKGVAIGNPLLDFETDMNSKGEYLWSHGLISDSSFNEFTSKCNYSTIRRQIMRTGSLTPNCKEVSAKISEEIGNIDVYNVIGDLCTSSVALQSRILHPMQDKRKIDACIEHETNYYLNRKDVQEALHARLVGVDTWQSCTGNHYDVTELEVPTIHLLGSLVKSGIRVLVYSGDQDSVIPLLGTRTLIHKLSKELDLNTSVPYSPWFSKKQVGGWTEEYGKLLSFATIRGAAHEAPLSQPQRSLVLFRSFLAGKPLPPPPGND